MRLICDICIPSNGTYVYTDSYIAFPPDKLFIRCSVFMSSGQSRPDSTAIPPVRRNFAWQASMIGGIDTEPDTDCMTDVRNGRSHCVNRELSS